MLQKIAAQANNVAETINDPEITPNSPVRNSRLKIRSFNKLLILKIQISDCGVTIIINEWVNLETVV
jgi:hypothetical protein